MRKTNQAALSDLTDDVADRLEFLKRNREFLDDLEVYNNLPNTKRADLALRQKEGKRLMNKWKLPFILPIRSTVDLNYLLSPIPVQIVSVGRMSYAAQLRARRDGRVLTDDEVAGRFATLQIDTSQTIENLLPLIEKTLRDIYRANPTPRRRRRPKEAEFQLQVFNMVNAGRDFPSVARKLRRSLSTVKSSFAVATWKIYGEKKNRQLTRLAGFDPDVHMRECNLCKQAKRIEEFCEQARAFVEQDQRSQREKTGLDTTGEFRRTRLKGY